MAKTAMEGNQAVAYAMRQVRPDVVAAYPISPQTEVVQAFADHVAAGEVDTQYVAVESEHSAMSACVGSAAAGARTMTASASQGIALMWEVLYIAAGLRLPIVMAVINRALSANINIHCDHSDSMGCRDTGWLQIYAEDVQEGYDNIIQAVKIAERCDLPVMACLDGYILSHAMESLDIIEDDKVYDFVGSIKSEHSLLDLQHPVTFGPIDMTDYYFEHKRQQLAAFDGVLDVIKEVGQQYGRLSGRPYGLFEAYRLEDADYGILAMGSAAGTTKDVIDDYRQQGKKVGLLKLRVFRPFPTAELADAVSHLKALAVLDRASSPGAAGGPLFLEVTSALYAKKANVPVLPYIYGLGGREFGPHLVERVYAELPAVAGDGKVQYPVRYLGVRE